LVFSFVVSAGGSGIIQQAEHGVSERPEKAQQFFARAVPDNGARFIAETDRGYLQLMQRFGYLLPDCGRSIPVLLPKAPERS
jgi:hypothetical protein